MSRRWLWGAAACGIWAVSTLGVVVLYDRLFRVEQPPPQVVKHIHQRPVIQVSSPDPEAHQVRSAREESKAPVPTVVRDEASALEEQDPELREIERRERFHRIVKDFEGQSYSGTEGARKALLQTAIDSHLESLPVAASVRRGDIECRGGGCSMPISFSPDCDFQSFDAAIRQATSTDAMRDDRTGLRPLRALHTYKDGDQVVGRYFFRWKEQ